MSVRRSAWGVYDLFSCAGGEQVFVAVVSDTQWRAFCEQFPTTQLAALAADPALDTNRGRVDNRDRLLPALTTLFGELSLAQALAALESAGVPFAEIRKPADLFDDPHLGADGLMELHIADGDRRWYLGRACRNCPSRWTAGASMRALICRVQGNTPAPRPGDPVAARN